MKLKAYISIHKLKKNNKYPTITTAKPTKKEIVNDKDFGYETYECEITYNEKKPLK